MSNGLPQFCFCDYVIDIFQCVQQLRKLHLFEIKLQFATSITSRAFPGKTLICNLLSHLYKKIAKFIFVTVGHPENFCKKFRL